MTEPSAIVVEIAGRIDRADVAALCEHVHAGLRERGVELVICDVSALAEPDCVAVDALARAALTARRLGRGFRLRGASPDLQALLCFVGLGEVLEEGATSGVRPRWEPE